MGCVLLNIFERLLSWIISKFKKVKLKTKEKISDTCQLSGCNTTLNIINGKKCKYCDKYFCIAHLAPAENHNCKGKLTDLKYRFRELYSKGNRTIISK